MNSQKMGLKYKFRKLVNVIFMRTRFLALFKRLHNLGQQLSPRHWVNTAHIADLLGDGCVSLILSKRICHNFLWRNVISASPNSQISHR